MAFFSVLDRFCSLGVNVGAFESSISLTVAKVSRKGLPGGGLWGLVLEKKLLKRRFLFQNVL